MQTQFYDYLKQRTTSRDFSGVQIFWCKHESGNILVTFNHSINYFEEFLIEGKEWALIKYNHFSQ